MAIASTILGSVSQQRACSQADYYAPNGSWTASAPTGPTGPWSGSLPLSYSWVGPDPAPVSAYWLLTTNSLISGWSLTGVLPTLTSTYGTIVPNITLIVPPVPIYGVSQQISNTLQVLPMGGSSPLFTDTYSSAYPATGMQGESGFYLTFSMQQAFTITLSGTSSTGHIWIRAPCSAALTNIPPGFSIVPGSEQWLVSGNTFTSWANNSGFPGVATAPVLGISGATTNGPTWYWYGKGNGVSSLEQVGVTCTVNTPTGGTMNIVESAPVHVDEPQWSANVAANSSCYYVDESSLGFGVTGLWTQYLTPTNAPGWGRIHIWNFVVVFSSESDWTLHR